ncbi:hypothetical protein RSSM_06108 [Rhodopirellula sallentina SM41]|uniref:Uncharacterized protein n=1 Tax=Rhodopirellula sallentina SM41 TaxID=1263870 RepID=M5U3F6_9BACT|nr:hypothetical protein RSSM_06108 [Rhodopirellula sallentina SM41]
MRSNEGASKRRRTARSNKRGFSFESNQRAMIGADQSSIATPAVDLFKSQPVFV